MAQVIDDLGLAGGPRKNERGPLRAKIVYRYSPEGVGWQETRPLGREIVAFPEIYVDSFDVDIPAAMQPVFNVVWNSFGLAQCEIYDGQGKLRGVS
jgi:hypothetical protein